MPRPHYRIYPGITSLAREFRKNQTLFEIVVWNEELKNINKVISTINEVILQRMKEI